MGSPAGGLCNLCRHQRLVPNRRGSVFSLCERSRSDERFPRYPRLPVLECVGFEARPEEAEPPDAPEPPISPSGPAPPAG